MEALVGSLLAGNGSGLQSYTEHSRLYFSPFYYVLRTNYKIESNSVMNIYVFKRSLIKRIVLIQLELYLLLNLVYHSHEWLHFYIIHKCH